jgi:transposase-like protein
MRAKITLIRKSRRYSEDFKKELVRLFETGKFSVLQLDILYGVPFNLIYRWIYQYSTTNEKGYRVVEMKQSRTSKVKDLEQKIKQLEQLLGQKQIQIDFLEKMIQVAEQELKIDIKKKSSTSQSLSSGKSEKS